MPFFVWVAVRYLRARVRQTALTISGVTLGVMVVTIMQSYIGGFQAFFIERTLQSTPSVTVTQTQPGLPNPAGPVERVLTATGGPAAIEVQQLPVPSTDKDLENPRLAETAIARIPGVQAIAPFVTGQGLVINGDLREPVSYVGVQPLEEARVTDFQARLQAGTVEGFANTTNGIVLGVVLARRLSAGLGDRVTVLTPQGQSLRFEVVGIYAADIEDIDRTRGYIHLRQAQHLRGTRGVSGLAVKTPSLETATAVARRIEAETDYTAKTWREVNTGILDLFTTISIIVYLVVGQTLIVAGFGIANTLILTVSEKRRDIGVLKAMGATPRMIAGLFVVTGVLVGLIGTMLGELLGAAGIAVLARTPVPFRGTEEGSTTLQFFPVLQIARVYLVSAIFGVVISVAASVLPSLRAAKSDPLEVIRGAE